MVRSSHRAEASPLLDLWTVITGASKGIGLGIAHAFVAAGANVVLVARDATALERARDELRDLAAPSQQLATISADMADPDAIAQLFESLGNEIPRLDVVVANAGSGTVTPFLEIPLAEWDRTIALNLTGAFLCCQHAARAMSATASENGAILVVSSIRAGGVRPGRLAYSVTKAGLNQLVRVAAFELAPLGIRVNALSPGITETPLALETNPQIFAEAVETVPLRRAGTPADMAAAAVYLCSPAAKFVTGANLVVDGGESLW